MSINNSELRSIPTMNHNNERIRDWNHYDAIVKQIQSKAVKGPVALVKRFLKFKKIVSALEAGTAPLKKLPDDYEAEFLEILDRELKDKPDLIALEKICIEIHKKHNQEKPKKAKAISYKRIKLHKIRSYLKHHFSTDSICQKIVRDRRSIAAKNLAYLKDHLGILVVSLK